MGKKYNYIVVDYDNQDTYFFCTKGAAEIKVKELIEDNGDERFITVYSILDGEQLAIEVETKTIITVQLKGGQ